MTVARTLKKLLFGETWIMPLGLIAVLAGTVLARHVLGEEWSHVGGFVLLTGVTAVLILSVRRSARRR
jgi:hypothetical protein